MVVPGDLFIVRPNLRYLANLLCVVATVFATTPGLPVYAQTVLLDGPCPCRCGLHAHNAPQRCGLPDAFKGREAHSVGNISDGIAVRIDLELV